MVKEEILWPSVYIYLARISFFFSLSLSLFLTLFSIPVFRSSLNVVKFKGLLPESNSKKARKIYASKAVKAQRKAKKHQDRVGDF